MSKSNIYTRGGDRGTTSLVGGMRVSKDSARLEAYGTIDELNSHIGLVAASDILGDSERRLLAEIQNRLFDIGSILATEPESRWQPQPLPASAIETLERAIDDIDGRLPRHNRFILPGGHPDAARCHVARCVARRAERRIVTLSAQADVHAAVAAYVNRLSDLLFVMARLINILAGVEEIFWQKNV